MNPASCGAWLTQSETGTRHLDTHVPGGAVAEYATSEATRHVCNVPHGRDNAPENGGEGAGYLADQGLALAEGDLTREFTGKERDAETGLDYFGARYYGGAQGRFTSPDRPSYDWNPGDPQSWNLYSYVRNSPLVYTDPDGRACVSDKEGNEHNDNNGGQSCEDARKKEQKDKPSATVYGGPEAAKQEVREIVGDFLTGKAPKEVVYGSRDPFTISFQRSAAMDAIVAGIKKDCSQAQGRVSVGTGEAFVNTAIDGILGGEGFLTPQAQLGAFNTTFSKSDGRVDIQVTNPISLNSLAFHATAPLGIKNPEKGPLSTVNQILQFAIADPCR